MSQFENQQDPNMYAYGDPAAEPQRTSGLAIAALVLGLVGVIPCLGLITGPIGILLGLIGVATISPPKTGKGIAAAGLVVGVLSLYPVHYLYYAKVAKPYFIEPMMAVMGVMMEGPADAMTEGFAGNMGAFKAKFDGAGASASDDEARAFIDELRDRYGEFVSSRLDQSAGGPAQPPMGQKSFTMPYLLTFDDATVSAKVEIVIVENPGQAPPVSVKYGYILVEDADQGDVRYPALDAAPDEDAGEGAEDAAGEP